MKRVLIFLYCSISLSLGQSTVVLPRAGSFFYRDAVPYFGSKQIKIEKSSADLVREAFNRMAPKSIKSDSDILRKLSRMDSTAKRQYLGWFFETVVKNSHGDFNYVGRSNARMSDLTGKLPDGRFFNCQLKAHKSGSPVRYFRDLQRYNNMLVIPDDHVEPLKQHMMKKIMKTEFRERELAKILSPTEEQIGRLNNLGKNRLKLEQQLGRVTGGGISYRGLEDTWNKGVMDLKYKGATDMNLLGKVGKIGKFLAGPLEIAAYAADAYGIYSSYGKLQNNDISSHEFYREISSIGIGIGAPLVGAFIGSAVAVGGPPGWFVGGAVGAAVGFFGQYASGMAFDWYYSKLDNKAKFNVEEYVNELYGYNGDHPMPN